MSVQTSDDVSTTSWSGTWPHGCLPHLQLGWDSIFDYLRQQRVLLCSVGSVHANQHLLSSWMFGYLHFMNMFLWLCGQMGVVAWLFKQKHCSWGRLEGSSKEYPKCAGFKGTWLDPPPTRLKLSTPEWRFTSGIICTKRKVYLTKFPSLHHWTQKSWRKTEREVRKAWLYKKCVCHICLHIFVCKRNALVCRHWSSMTSVPIHTGSSWSWWNKTTHNNLCWEILLR